jgi:hypothetical protein
VGDRHERGITLGELKQELQRRTEPSDKTFATPLISATTIDRMLDEYDLYCERPNSSDTPYNLLLASSLRYMAFIKFSEGHHSLGKLYRFFFEQYVKGTSNAEGQEEVATVGAGFVISAFHREGGPEFIDNFKTITTSQAKSIIAGSLEGHRLVYRNTAYKRGSSNLSLPHDQPHLKYGLDEIKPALNGEYHMAFEDGAISAFNVLTQMRPLFRPKEQVDITEALSPAKPRLLL